jgi:hypothetical protein
VIIKQIYSDKKASRFGYILGGFLFLLLLIFPTCATGSPVNTTREGPVSFTTVQAVQPQWQPLADGIGYFHGKTDNPRLEFWALRIDLHAPNTRIVVKGGADGDGTLGTKVSSFVRSNDLLAGINAVPFDVISAREGLPIKNMGLVISGGELIAPVNPNYDALVFYRDGHAAVVRQSAVSSIVDIENAVGGFHQILAGTEATQRTLNREDRHPRSAAGISADGGILYLLVIDGRREGSSGGTEKETALLLRALGSTDGINLDGGGSSALVLRYPDGRVRAVNTPIHGGIPGQERAVAGCLGVSSVFPREDKVPK